MEGHRGDPLIPYREEAKNRLARKMASVKQDNRKKLLVYRSQLVNGLFAEMEEALEEYTGTPAYAQRVADALNGQDVPPEHVYNVLDNFYGMGEAAPVTRRWWE